MRNLKKRKEISVAFMHLTIETDELRNSASKAQQETARLSRNLSSNYRLGGTKPYLPNGEFEASWDELLGEATPRRRTVGVERLWGRREHLIPQSLDQEPSRSAPHDGASKMDEPGELQAWDCDGRTI